MEILDFLGEYADDRIQGVLSALSVQQTLKGELMKS